MGRNDSYKILVIIGGLFGLFSVLSYFLSESIGAWWQVTFEFWRFESNTYINAFGYSEDRQLLGDIAVLAGALFLLGSIIAIIGSAKESKNVAIISALMMLAGLGLFLYALSEWEDFSRTLDVLEFMSGGDYNIFYGSHGNLSWGLSTGFFIGVISALLVLIGAIKLR
jgi:hypothetical protein